MIPVFKTPKRQKQDARLQGFFWKLAENTAASFQNRNAALEKEVAKRATHKANDN